MDNQHEQNTVNTQENTRADDKVVVKLKKPYIYEGRQVEEIVLDLDGLTGRDMMDAQKQYSAKGNFAVLPAYDMGYCAHLAAYAAGERIDFIEGLSAADFSAVTGEVTRFLTVKA